MIVNGSYHKFFIITEQLHLLGDIVSLDILTTHESCVSVNGFSITNRNYSANNPTYHKNCYLWFICKVMTRLQS